MKILFLMDPQAKLNMHWDNSLFLLSELSRRGHETFAADFDSLSKAQGRLIASGFKVTPGEKVLARHEVRRMKFQHVAGMIDLAKMNRILIRKDPPVDEHYIAALKFLIPLSKKIPFQNSPSAILKTNEKLSILDFPKWIPASFVSDSVPAIQKFFKKLRKPIVVKPLNLKGGEGVFLVSKWNAQVVTRIRSYRETVMVQEYLKNTGRPGEKRILILDGKFLAVYEKRPRRGEFRANLGLGARYLRSTLTKQEKKMVLEIGPVLARRELSFVGLDVLNEKLIEINVTSPAGVREATTLYRSFKFVREWADSVESLRCI